jgi:hypothetical protein
MDQTLATVIVAEGNRLKREAKKIFLLCKKGILKPESVRTRD